MDCLEDLKISGKILNYGVSNFDIDSTKSISRSWQLSSIQDSFNLLDYKNSCQYLKMLVL